MPRSMTGYARSCGLLHGKNIAVEIHSVNKRGCDIHTYLPQEFLSLDGEIKKWISTSCHRGNVTFRLLADPFREMGMELVERADQELQKMAKGLGFTETRPYPFSFVLEQAGRYITLAPPKDLLPALEPLVKKAIQEWNEMREREGAFLVRDIEKRWEKIVLLRQQLLSHKDGGAERLREKLTTLLQEITGALSEDDHRCLLKEVVIVAEKADIAEELVRLEAHLEQFILLLRSTKTDIGKTLDFFVQEMLREANTIASKASDIALIHGVVEMKGELEKIREQVQNIE